jgi:hypothetical protein
MGNSSGLEYQRLLDEVSYTVDDSWTGCKLELKSFKRILEHFEGEYRYWNDLNTQIAARGQSTNFAYMLEYLSHCILRLKTFESHGETIGFDSRWRQVHDFLSNPRNDIGGYSVIYSKSPIATFLRDLFLENYLEGQGAYSFFCAVQMPKDEAKLNGYFKAHDEWVKRREDRSSIDVQVGTHEKYRLYVNVNYVGGQYHYNGRVAWQNENGTSGCVGVGRDEAARKLHSHSETIEIKYQTVKGENIHEFLPRKVIEAIGQSITLFEHLYAGDFQTVIHVGEVGQIRLEIRDSSYPLRGYIHVEESGGMDHIVGTIDESNYEEWMGKMWMREDTNGSVNTKYTAADGSIVSVSIPEKAYLALASSMSEIIDHRTSTAKREWERLMKRNS